MLCTYLGSVDRTYHVMLLRTNMRYLVDIPLGGDHSMLGSQYDLTLYRSHYVFSVGEYARVVRSKNEKKNNKMS